MKTHLERVPRTSCLTTCGLLMSRNASRLGAAARHVMFNVRIDGSQWGAIGTDFRGNCDGTPLEFHCVRN